MKTRKLSKSIKLKNLGEWNDSNDGPDSTFRTSIDELKCQPSRQSLRQHFTGAFPETQLRPSLELEESTESSDMRVRHKLSRTNSTLTTTHASVDISSSSSTSVNSTEFKRLSTVQESNAKIDIAEVIRLLQELRRTASPAELVALHKALLPTSDSVIHSPRLASPIDEDAPLIRPSFVRRRSMLPPGVATRNASKDPLSSHEEDIAGLDRARPHTQPTSKSEIAALDLADDVSRVTMFRSLTPMDHDDIPMGAFRHGTLRVTNGAASPDPYAIRKSAELHDRAQETSKVEEEFETASSTPNFNECLVPDQSNTQNVPRRRSLLAFSERWLDYENASEYQRSHRQQYDLNKSRRFSEPATSGASGPRIEERSSSKYEPTAFERASMSHHQSRKPQPPQTESSEERPQSQTPRCIDGPQLEQRGRQMSQQDSFDVCKQTTNDVADSTVLSSTLQAREPPNKTEIPRFAQRWSHRLSHMSMEARSGSPLPSNPFEDNTALHNLSKRLSTVTGRTLRERSEEGSTARETPEVALAKLNGEIDSRKFKRPRDCASNNASGSPLSSAESPCDTGKRPSQPQKTDSGYSSDMCHLSMDQKEEKEPRKSHQTALSDVTEHSHKAYEGLSVEHDEVSLYSFNQVLNSPALLSGLATPSPPDARGSKKHLSLLGLNKTKRSNSLQAQSPTDTTFDQSPVQQKDVKPPKKLQKAMPTSARKHAKSEIVKDAGKSSKVPVTLDLHDDLEDTFAQSCGVKPFTSSAGTIAQLHMPVGPGRNSQLTNPSYTPSNNQRPSISAPKLSGGNEAFMNARREMSTEIKGPSEAPSKASRKRSGSSKITGGTTSKASHDGMEANLASELARSKSQDIPVLLEGTRIDYLEQARPTCNSSETSRAARIASSPVAAVSQGGDAALPLGLREIASRSPKFNAASIPPLPKLSARVSKRISGYDAMAPKRPEDSVPSKPVVAASSSSNRPGDSTESIADVVNRAVQARKVQGTVQEKERQESNVLRPPGVHKSRSKRKARKARSRELDSSDTEALELGLSDDGGALPFCARDSERSGLEQHAKIRRERREQTGQKLRKASLVDERPEGARLERSVTPPVIVVSNAATPSNGKDAREAFGLECSNSVELGAAIYQDSQRHGEGTERKDDGVKFRSSTTTVVKVHDSGNRSLASNEPVHNPYSLKSYDASSPRTERSRSPGGRVVTASGNYHPYKPAGAERAKKSHAESLARLIGVTPPISSTTPGDT